MATRTLTPVGARVVCHRSTQVQPFKSSRKSCAGGDAPGATIVTPDDPQHGVIPGHYPEGTLGSKGLPRQARRHFDDCKEPGAFMLAADGT